MSKKKNKMNKNNNKLITGVVMGTVAGLLTFLLVKPKISNKSKEEVSNNMPQKEKNSSRSNDLFI